MTADCQPQEVQHSERRYTKERYYFDPSIKAVAVESCTIYKDDCQVYRGHGV
jgi:hypothetical protein